MRTPESSRPPYPGLRCFEAEEADLFFGREQHVDALLDRLSRSHFVAVVGESGAGKSSLVRAGLLPALQAGFVVEAGSDWRVAVMRPGAAPLAAFADALLAPGVLSESGGVPRREVALAELRRGPFGLVQLVCDSHLDAHCNTLIVVDQFEEVFRYCREPAQKDQANVFVELLLRASAQREVPIFVVLTMRSDFVGECARFRGLPERLNDNQYLTPRLTRDEIALAIVGPARVCGGVVETTLVDELCNAVGDNQDQLPLLQHLLMRSWERARAESNPPRLVPELARAMGGLNSALNNHAQQVYDALAYDEQRAIARAMFKRLTDPHGERRDLRRDALVSEIAAVADASVPAVIAVADEFRADGRHMLMPPPSIPLDGGSRIDISHETLLRQWSTLSEWAREEGTSAHEFERLVEEAERERAGQGELISGRDLARAQDWMKQEEPTKAWAERYAPDGALETTLAFIRNSEAKAKRQKDEKLRAAARKARNQRYMTMGAIALAGIGAVVALLVFDLYQEATAQGARVAQALLSAREETKRADKNAAIARTNEAVAKAHEIEAQLHEDSARTKSVELEAQRDKADAIQLAASARAELRNDPALAVLLARKALQSGHSDALAMRSLRASLAEHVPNVESEFEVAKSRNYVSKSAKRASTWLNFSLDESSRSLRDDWIVVPSGKNAIVWSATDGRTIRTLGGAAGHSEIVGAAAFSPDGQLVATSSADHTVRVWDTTTGRLVGPPLQHESIVNNAVFNQDGSLLVTAEDNNLAHVWTVSDFSKRCALRRKAGGGNFISGNFSADQTLLVTVTHSGGRYAAQVWNVADQECPEQTPPALRQIGDLRSASFSPTGPWLGVVTTKGEAIVLDASDWSLKLRLAPAIAFPRITQTYPPPEAFPPSLAWGRDGSFAVAGGDHVVRLTTVQNARPPIELRGHTENVTSISFNRTGDRVLTTSVDRTARLWSLRADGPPLEVIVMKGHKDTVGSGTFSRNGEIVTASNDGRVRSWKPRLAVQERAFPEVLAASGAVDGIHILLSRMMPEADNGLLEFERSSGGITIRDARHPSKSLLLAESNGVRPGDLRRSPDGRFVMGTGATSGRAVKVWDLRKPDARPQAHPEPEAAQGACVARAISSAGRIAWYCADQDRILIADGGRTLPISVELSEKRKLKEIQFSPTGRWLAVTFEDTSSLEVLDTQKRKSHATLRAPYRPITTLAFSADDRFVVAANDDSTARVWDVENAVEVAVFSALGKPTLNGAAFSPDGLSVRFVANDRLLSWRCYACGDRDALLQEVRDRRIRCQLSEDQKRRFGLNSQELNSDDPHPTDHSHRRF